MISWGLGRNAELATMAIFFPDAPLLAYQQIPALTALCLAGVGGYWLARRGGPKRLLDRKVEPLAARQVWAGVPVVVIIAIAIALIPLPPPAGTTPITRDSPTALRQRQPLVVPAGWH